MPQSSNVKVFGLYGNLKGWSQGTYLLEIDKNELKTTNYVTSSFDKNFYVDQNKGVAPTNAPEQLGLKDIRVHDSKILDNEEIILLKPVMKLFRIVLTRSMFAGS